MLGLLNEKLRYARTQMAELGLGAAVRYKFERLKGRSVGHSAPYTLTSKHLSYPVQVRPGSSDLMVFNQIFVEREYRCLDDLEEASFIIDCGANVGYSSAYFLSRFPNARVVAIEPEASNFAALRANTRAFGSRISTLQAGVWSRPCGLVVERPETPTNEWAFTVRESVAGEHADAIGTDLTTIWRDAGCPTISILKIDIEGSETVVLAAAEKPWLDSVENLVIELHDEHAETAFGKAIAGQGFSISVCGELTVCRRPVRKAN
jgi:FkbM family methyltransferase